MATGSYDANGIWQYGEDDNIALFADTLNKLADSTSDAFTADRGRISTLEAGSLAGMIPVKPTSVQVASGSGSFNSLGTVTFTGATQISLNGVFTPTYRNYHIVIQASCAASGNSTYFRTRSGGVDSGGAADYLNSAQSVTFAGVTGVVSGSSNALFIAPSTSGQPSSIALTVTNPRQPVPTQVLFQSYGYGSTWMAYQGAGMHTLSGSYDGFTFYTSGSTLTGTVTVYGYNN